MHALLVEDTAAKRDEIQRFYQNEFPMDSLLVADSLIAGLKLARDSRPGFIILDMTLPNYSSSSGGGYNEMRPFAGRECISRARRMRFETSILVVSMFETFGQAPNLITLESIDEEFKRDFEDIYLGSVYYSSSSSGWRRQIADFRQRIELK